MHGANYQDFNSKQNLGKNFFNIKTSRQFTNA